MKYKFNDIVYQLNSDEPLIVTGYLEQEECTRYYILRPDGTEEPCFESQLTDVKPYDFTTSKDD